MDCKYDVFISYSSKDKDFARLLDKKLRATGLKPFFDDRDIPWGGSIPLSIENALDNSKNLIIILSPDAVESEWVDLERCITIFVFDHRGKNYACEIQAMVGGCPLK